MAAKKENNKKNEPVKAKSAVPFIRASIDRILDNPESKVVAIASVSLGEHFALHGLKIYDDGEKLSVLYPGVKSNKDGQYYEHAHPISAQARAAVNRYVTEAYYYKLEQMQKNGQKETEPSDDTTEDMNDNESQEVTGPAMGPSM